MGTHKKYFTQNYINFFEELELNNNKEWFGKNKDNYSQHVDKPFHEFIAQLLIRIHKLDSKINIEARDAIFRIYRDLRFSKDKTPYKAFKSALISSKGRRSKEEPGFYIEIGAKHIKLAGGCFKLKPIQIQEIIKHLKSIKSISNDQNFIQYWGDLTIGKNSITFETLLSPELIKNGDLENLILMYWKTIRPVIKSFKELLENRDTGHR